MIASENARVEEAKQAAAVKITEIEEQLRTCLQALERIKEANRPANAMPEPDAFERTDRQATADALAMEISANLEAQIGTTEEHAPRPEPRHPVADTTSKFTNLQFGRNYDLNKK